MSAFCEQAKWKREEIPDHKFDYVDVDEFIDESFGYKLKYLSFFLLTLKWLLVYVVDVLIMGFLFATNSFSDTKNCRTSPHPGNGSTPLPGTDQGINTRLTCAQSLDTEKILPSTLRPFVILISILISLILLFVDCRNARTVIKSRDISYAYTTPVAYRYYSIKSFAYFCLFNQIQNSRKTVDVMAFFVFFQFKGWKRLILAEFPRQLIFSLNLRDVVNSLSKNPSLMMQFIEAYGHVAQSKPTLELMAFTLSALSVGIWVFSFVSLMVAFVVFVPLLCMMRGNLKEYVCHKIDKRTGDLLKRQARKRTEQARKAEHREIERKRQALAIGQWNEDAESEFSSTAPPLGMTQRPTLPDIDVDLDLPLSYTTASSSPCLSAVHGTLHSSCPRYPSSHRPPYYHYPTPSLHDSAVADFASGSRRSRTRSIASGGSPHLSFSREMTAVNSGTPVPPPLGLPPSLLFDRITAAGGSPFLGPTVPTMQMGCGYPPSSQLPSNFGSYNAQHPIPPSMTMPMMGTMAHHHLPMHFTGSLARPPYVHPAAGLPRSASSAPTVEGRRGTPSPSPPPGFCGDYGFGGWGDGFLVVQRDVDEIDVRDG